MASREEPPWHASLPKPRHTAPLLPAHRALQILTLKIASLLIIDVRGLDYAGGSIRNSLNVPAQAFYWNKGQLYELCYKADIQWVVFTCMSSSEGGRAARCAGWFLEHVRDVAGDADMQVLRLEGGVKGWVRGGEGYVRCMDGFRREVWEERLREEEEEKAGRREAGNAGPALQGGAGAGVVAG